MSQIDMFDTIDFSIQLSQVSTASRDYNAIIMVIGGLRFSCDLQDGLGGERQIKIIRKIAESANVEIQAYGALKERFGNGERTDG